MIKNYLTTFYILLSSTVAFAQTDSSSVELENVEISASTFFGSKKNSMMAPGSSYFLSPKEIQELSYIDISRMLAKVPGVNSIDEDGFGLRPNISLRGVSAERSAKITLLEDEVLIAPAPYSAPAAYYFPTAARMNSIEVLKGSSQIEYGPFTTGGALNLVSQPITFDKLSLQSKALYGSYGNRNLDLTISQNFGKISYLIQGMNYGSNGFKKLPNNGNTGFNKNDVLAKIRFAKENSNGILNSFELKTQYSNENSNETYLGITEADFVASPFQRYAASMNDKMKTEHYQIAGTYSLDLKKSFRFITTAYLNGFKRNWYKLNDVKIDGASVGIAKILNDPEKYSNYLDILKGGDSQEGALNLKNNNRKYQSSGIQLKMIKYWTSDNTKQTLEAGLRFHTDYEDRFQWVDKYQMKNSSLVLNSKGTPGTDANRITSAEAFSSFLLYKLTINNKIILSPGLRLESLTLKRKDYGKNDVDRLGTNISLISNKATKLIPGIGANFLLSKEVLIFTGVHSGFAPPSVNPDTDPENSINTEIGTRISHGKLYTEFVLFQNNYSNLLGSDLAASGGQGTLDQFNAGKVRVNGIEFLLNYDFSPNSSFKLPFEFSYTHTNSKFLSSFESSEEIWGTISYGDELPYIPRNQFFSGFGFSNKTWNAKLNARYNGEFRTVAGAGPIPRNEKIPSYFVLDLAGKYSFKNGLSIQSNINNLLNKTYMVSRVPSGLRPGLPFSFMAGLEFNL